MTITFFLLEWNPYNGFLLDILGIEGESGTRRSLLSINACKSFAYISILYLNFTLFNKTGFDIFD